MIQEPPSQHQSDPIDIPMVTRDSMKLSNLTTPALDSATTTTSTSTSHPLNCKNRTTIIQIPKQNSKPRIFLLTRPAKPPLVRIATPAQTVQAHQNQNDHQGKNNHRAIVPKIIRIPFLTSSPTKGQAIQGPRKDLTTHQYQPLKDLNQITVLPPRSQSEHKLNDSLIIHQEIIQAPKSKIISPLSSAPVSRSVDQHQVLTKIRPESVKTTIKTTIQENTVHLAKTKISEPIVQLTLDSMAGIELTGADMSHTAADMSGAMPPTATVEEINVPVFIDEYLQQAAISTTAASVTTQNINYNINNNSSISNNNNNNNPSNRTDNGEENACLDTFENFEFDIELLTENNSKDQDKARLHHHQHHQQQQQLAVDDIQQQPHHNLDNSMEHNNNIEEDKDKQKQQLQLMLDEILFNNNQSYCNNNNNNNGNILNNNMTNNNNNINKMANNMYDDLFNGNEEYLFSLAPTSQNLVTDEIDLSDFSPAIENAVDFNQPNNECLSLMDLETDGVEETNNTPPYHINSSDIMLPWGNSKSFPFTLTQEISKAEPHVSPDQIHYPNSSFSFTNAAPSPPLSHQSDSNDQIDLFEDVRDCIESRGNPLKRNNAAQTKMRMEQKRSKLHFDIKRRIEVEAMPQPNVLDTPNIINSILQNEEPMSEIRPAENTMDILYNLIDSPHESIVKSELDFSDYTNDISLPNTPHSVNSSSNQTNFTDFINSAPNSPASSIATTNATSSTARRGRGRPAKLHSDVPDISQLKHLPENEKKKLLERAKNNEASRKSRLKNKERDIAIEREERDLSRHNEKLRLELLNVKKVERKLRQALKRQHFKGSPY